MVAFTVLLPELEKLGLSCKSFPTIFFRLLALRYLNVSLEFLDRLKNGPDAKTLAESRRSVQTSRPQPDLRSSDGRPARKVVRQRGGPPHQERGPERKVDPEEMSEVDGRRLVTNNDFMASVIKLRTWT